MRGSQSALGSNHDISVPGRALICRALSAAVYANTQRRIVKAQQHQYVNLKVRSFLDKDVLLIVHKRARRTKIDLHRVDEATF